MVSGYVCYIRDVTAIEFCTDFEHIGKTEEKNMNEMSQRFCQCCGMPMGEIDELFGTNADGSRPTGFSSSFLPLKLIRYIPVIATINPTKNPALSFSSVFRNT